MSRSDCSVPSRVVLAAAVLLTSCGTASLTLNQWQPRWQEVVERVEEVTTDLTTQAQCEQALRFLREQRPRLTPPPLEDLQGPVTSWFDEAEDAFFECRFDINGRRTRESLAALETEVETVLSLET